MAAEFHQRIEQLVDVGKTFGRRIFVRAAIESRNVTDVAQMRRTLKSQFANDALGDHWQQTVDIFNTTLESICVHEQPN